MRIMMRMIMLIISSSEFPKTNFRCCVCKSGVICIFLYLCYLYFLNNMLVD